MGGAGVGSGGLSLTKGNGPGHQGSLSATEHLAPRTTGSAHLQVSIIPTSTFQETGSFIVVTFFCFFYCLQKKCHDLAPTGDVSAKLFHKVYIFLFSPLPQAGLAQAFCEFPVVFPDSGPVSNPQEVGFQREQGVGGSAIPIPLDIKDQKGPASASTEPGPAEPACLLNTERKTHSQKAFGITEVHWRDCYSANSGGQHFTQNSGRSMPIRERNGVCSPGC